ncbi:MAG: cytochrome c [Thermoguttaceae bacterium]|nr:cytochrome c [Thermoguttaceae bacterium]
MKSTVVWSMLATLVAVATGLAAMAADPPAAPKVSTFAPAEDLVPQIDEYIKGFDEAVASEDEYKDAESTLKKDANVFVLIAVALAVHDEDNQYKQAAPALIEAGEKLAAAEGYAQAKAAVAAVKAAKTAKGDPTKIAWSTKHGGMTELMQAVPLIHSRLKRYMRGTRFEKSAAENAQYSAVIAVVGQGSMPHVEDTDKPTEVVKWYEYCAQMRDAAASVNKAVRAKNQADAEKAMDALQKSCDDCHSVFHPE